MNTAFVKVSLDYMSKLDEDGVGDGDVFVYIVVDPTNMFIFITPFLGRYD